MRFRCIIGIIFFLTSQKSEGATKASCSMRIGVWMWFDQPEQLKTCDLNIDVVNDEDFTISSVYVRKFLGLTFSSAVDWSTLGLSFKHKPGVKFLPTNLFRVFPDLVAFEVWNCSVTTVSKIHLRSLSKLQNLNLPRNKIEHVASDAFVDLDSLEYLRLNDNRIQSLSSNTFSSLKNLKELYLYDNKIQHLDPNIFSSLVKVEKINLNHNLIAVLDEKTFESLSNLKKISLRNNKLNGIPRNVFQNNLKLENIWLNENEIKFIDANMFDHLPNLDYVDLQGNLCANKFYWKGSFDPMRSDLKQTCSKSSCGAPKHATGLIVRGESFSHGAFPWIVALMHTGYRPPKFFCAGTLISETFVVSAAQCILQKGASSEFLAQDIVAIFGAHDLNNPHESGRIIQSPKKIYIHEDWNHQRDDYDADISLLKFDSIPFSAYIQPICLWDSVTDPMVTTGVVTGWGRSEDTSKDHENLPKLVQAPILTNEKCWIGDKGLIDISSERTFCAGLRNGSGVCSGDSGGGLFIKVNGLYHLKGIVSSSMVTDQGCDVSRNAVYTNVLMFIDWIKKNSVA